MSEKSQLINKLKSSKKSRASYVRSLVSVNIASQTRALRRRQNMTQKKLADEAEMLQPRISVIERPGESQYTLETLIRLAAAFKVGLIVKFAPLSEMLRWENEFSQDNFDVVTIDKDVEFQREEKEREQLPIALQWDVFQRSLSGNWGMLSADPLHCLHEINAVRQPSISTSTEPQIPQPGSLGEERGYSKKLHVFKQKEPRDALFPDTSPATGSQTMPILDHH